MTPIRCHWAGNSITVIFEDRSGIMWFGTHMFGLNKWNARTWEYGLEPAKELTTDAERQPNVMAFAKDPSGTLWVGTFGDGLNTVDGEDRRR